MSQASSLLRPSLTNATLFANAPLVMLRSRRELNTDQSSTNNLWLIVNTTHVEQCIELVSQFPHWIILFVTTKPIQRKR